MSGGDGNLKIYLDNVLVDDETVKCNGKVFSYTASGASGTKELFVEVDGAEVMSAIINFDNGTYS